MEAIGGGLGLVATAVFIVTVIAIFRPIPSLWLPTRKRAAIACLGSLFVLGVAGSMLPKTAVTAVPAAATEAAAVNADAAGEATAVPVALVAPPPTDVGPEFVRFYREFEREFDTCNNAFDPIGQEAGSSSPSPQRLYAVSRNAKEVCRSSSGIIRDLEPPASFSADLKKEAKRLLDVCANAVIAQQLTADAAMKAIDDNFRPSRVQNMTDSGDRALQMKMGCVAGWLIQARALGVEDELT